MRYKKTVRIDAQQAVFIQKALQSVDMMGEDDTISNTARFGGGMEMDVKLCGARDEKPWTEAVLFKDGSEVCCSGSEESYDGPWELEYGGDTYTAVVVMEDQTRKETKGINKKNMTTTKVCKQCGGTEFASGYKTSIECIVDGSGRLARFLEPDIEDAKEACRNGMVAGTFECLSCGCKGETLEEITIAKEHPTIGACLIEKPGECGLDAVDIARMMQELGETEVYPVDFPAAQHECSAMGFISTEFAEALGYGYQELAKHIAGILDDMDQETEDGCYPFHGYTIILSR